MNTSDAGRVAHLERAGKLCAPIPTPFCDTGIYDKKYIFRLHLVPDFWHRAPWNSVSEERDKGVFFFFFNPFSLFSNFFKNITD